MSLDQEDNLFSKNDLSVKVNFEIFKLLMMNRRFIFLVIGLCSLIKMSYAQKAEIPQIQQSGIWMDNFEADGKLAEWQLPLEAYNNDTHIAYSVANDETYLYLVVKSNRTTKIFNGGITLEVMTPKKQPVSIVFPYDFTYDRRANPEIVSHPDKPWNLSDLKEIEINGIKNISTKTIPIINEYGIQVGISSEVEYTELYKEKGESFYIVELGIPLVYFDIKPTGEGGERIDYKIKLRGIIPSALFGGVGRGTGNILTSDGRIVQKYSGAQVEDQYQKDVDLYKSSELKGSYHLVTKKK